MSVKRSTIVWVAALAFAAVGQANAADMYRPSEGGYKDGPAYAGVNWAGFYAGVNGGYGWSPFSDQLKNTDFDAPAIGVSPGGGFGGGQIGYNWQGMRLPHLVLGVEADIQGSRINDTFKDNYAKYSSNLDWFGTVRGRVGYSFDRALVYATGGFAYGSVDNEITVFPTIPHTYRKSGLDTGYVLGGGLEYMVAPAWSIKAEYQYLNLGKSDPVYLGFPWSGFSGTKVEDDAFHTVRAGINYHVGGTYEPLK